MKKIIILLLVNLCGGTIVVAQVREPVNPLKDKQEFQGYTIQLMPAMHGTYGYYIVKDKQVVLHQNRNPFTGSPVSLSKKEDAYKVARWQIQNQKSIPVSQVARRPQKNISGSEKLPPAIRQTPQEQPPLLRASVPLKVAEDLHIKINR